MNVQRAVQVFPPLVTAAVKLLQEQAGHTCDASFAGVGPTVQFMDTAHRWFVLMDELQVLSYADGGERREEKGGGNCADQLAIVTFLVSWLGVFVHAALGSFRSGFCCVQLRLPDRLRPCGCFWYLDDLQPLDLLSSDFNEDCKIRKLKKDAVPSIFEEYPAYLQPPKNRERSDASVRKREAAAPVNTPPPKRRAVESQLESPSLPLNDLPSVDVASQELSLMDCSATELPLPLENSASERCITTTVQVDRAVQVSSLFSVSAMDKRKWRRKERDLNARIERLKNTVDKYKQELQKLKEECYVSAFLQVVEKAKEKDLAASILVEQVQNFAKKKPTWSEVTVRHAVVLRNLSTRAYEHVRSTVSFKIPVAYFFARNCTGRELHMLMRHVLKEVEEIGFFVVRIVTDNHKINVLAMQLLCNGSLKHCIDHPGKPNRRLFLAFDQCHLIKNVRSQFLSRHIVKGGEISANHLKSLCRMQQGSLVKPVRFLTRKHVFPTDMEKMNVQRAVQVFPPLVTAAVKLLQEQAGHTCDASFAGVGPTVQFMDTAHRWFVLMDVSNCTQHIHQKNADYKQFESAGGERLIWLETSFLDYLADLKSQCLAKNFLTKETYEGLVITTRSNVECIRYLLEEMSFHFVLTRKMSSDPIESFFGWLRKSAGSNDQTDVRAVLTGIEKTLKTGIASASNTSNIMAAEESDYLSTLPQQKNTREQTSEEFPAGARRELIERLNRDKPLLPTPDVAALAMVGGYLARAVREYFECVECFALLTKPNASTPSDSLIKHQDRGGLLYPSAQLLDVLYALQKFVEVLLARRRRIHHPLKEAVNNATEILREHKALMCSKPGHQENLLKLLLTKFFRAIFSNFALKATDKEEVAKVFAIKPLPRKTLKL
ncbi:hypothetical protein HPB49_010001 [Dermacentor silvarum]|uniref:Uncharacterized protein n=1 Tax=Dermacentor silvarum TaxID=543639 RepID=A0ACB8DYY2_DERSI|nr:hypothetical protein HPB49_010001 [Dermacentor silvarum]